MFGHDPRQQVKNCQQTTLQRTCLYYDMSNAGTSMGKHIYHSIVITAEKMYLSFHYASLSWREAEIKKKQQKFM